MADTSGSRRRTAILVIALSAVTDVSCVRDSSLPDTGSDLISFSHIDKAWAQSRGANVTVAVIDWQFDSTGSAADRFVFATSLIPGEKMGGLPPWHGAWMVDIVHRVAPEARIIPIIGRSLNRTDFQEALIQGIRYAAEHGAVAVTNSMGAVRESDGLRQAVGFAEQRGTLFVDVHPEDVAHLGEESRPCGAGDCDPRIVHAGVVSVPSHHVAPDPARDVYVWPYDLPAKFQDGWGYSNGPPVVAGVLALMKSGNPSIGPDDVRRILKRTSAQRDGFAVVDAAAAVDAAISLRKP